jgi:type IV pilus assembly protein PilW
MKNVSRHVTPPASGMSLIELMVAVAIGSLLMLGLATTFKNSSDTQREMERTGRLIENGRYATQLLTDDLHHAGYYGFYYEAVAAPAALPDPCETTSIPNLVTAMAMPIQGYAAANISSRPDISATSCDDKGLFTNANVSPGSDIFVIRRASTAVFSGTPITNEVYLQSNARTVSILRGNSSATVPAMAANNVAQTLRKFPHDTGDTTAADTYKYHNHVYFIAPCSFGTGTNDVCTTADDNIPTLKRLELTSTGTSTVMRIVPLVEGVEFMKVTYGIDTSPTDINLTTGFSGDGVPDAYIATPTAAQWPLVVAVRIYLLIRSTDPTPGHVDAKSYAFPPTGITLGPFNDQFKRHVYSTEVRPMNLAGRREIP